jgi:hypothetical protein
MASDDPESQRRELDDLRSRRRWGLIHLVVGSVVLAIVPWAGLQKPPGRIGALFIAFACVAVLWAGGWAWVLLSRFRTFPTAVVAIVVVCQAVYVEGLFAVLYYALSVESPQAFNVPLTRIERHLFHDQHSHNYRHGRHSSGQRRCTPARLGADDRQLVLGRHRHRHSGSAGPCS